MNNLTQKGSLDYGFYDAAKNVVHRDFEIKLLSVKDEIDIQTHLICEYPDFDSKARFEQLIIERVASLSKMIVSLGDLHEITTDMLLTLDSADFERFSDAELLLRKKRLEFGQKNTQTA